MSKAETFSLFSLLYNPCSLCPLPLFLVALLLPHLTTKKPTGNSILLCFSPVFSHLPLNCVSLIVLGTRADDGCLWASSEGILLARKLWGRSSISDGCGDDFPLTSFLPLLWFPSDSWVAADFLSLCVNWLVINVLNPFLMEETLQVMNVSFLSTVFPYTCWLSCHSVIACPMFSLDPQAKACFRGLLLSSVLLNADELVPFLIFGSKEFHRWSVYTGNPVCWARPPHEIRACLVWSFWGNAGLLGKASA